MADPSVHGLDLPSKGYISGRPATVEDAKAGNAVFSMNGGSKGALSIAIPQYALWKDAKGIGHPMIVVQAERAPDVSEIIGLRDFNGGETVATLPEVTLLGTGKPN
ncbi:MAG: hypothetical protein ABIS25_05025 [Sphingomicrobium sp.]